MAKKEIQKSALVIYMEEQQVPQDLQTTLSATFTDFYNQTQEWKEKAAAFKITDVSQVEEMKQAKIARNGLRNIRTTIEKERKRLKEESLRTSKIIDDTAKWLTALIVPTEEYLEEQEKFIERENAKIAEALLTQRKQLLAPYEVETMFYDLGNMPQELFNKLLEDSAILYHAKQEKAKQQEEEAAKQRIVTGRISQLLSIGYKAKEYAPDNDMYIHEDLESHIFSSWLIDYTEEEWKNIFASVNLEIEMQKKNREEAAQLKAEQLQKELDVQKTEQDKKIKRVERLAGLGLVAGSDCYYFPKKQKIELSKEFALDSTEESFESLVAGLTESINLYNQEVTRAEAQLNERKKELFALGFAMNGEKMIFQTLIYLISDIINLSNDGWLIFIDNTKQNVAAIKYQLEQERITNEQAVQAEIDAAKSDKQKFASLLQDLVNLRIKYQFKSKKYQKLYNSVVELIDKIVNYINERI